MERSQTYNLKIANFGTSALVADLPARGVRVELPKQLSNEILFDQQGSYLFTDKFQAGQRSISFSEEWLLAIANCSILKKRYPNPEDGQAFMNIISYNWREELLEKAVDIKDEIVDTLLKRGRERFTIILFGSVARNLVKHPSNEDPSNIDIVIIGDYTFEQKDKLLASIRSIREKFTQEIKCGECSFTESLINISPDNKTHPDSNQLSSGVERVGVFIQGIDCVKKNEYQPVRNYLEACAIPLYDEHQIWKQLTKEAMPYVVLHNLTHAQRRMARKYELIGWQEQSGYNQTIVFKINHQVTSEFAYIV